MVEHQHGISSFLSFGAKSVQPEILEQLLIGREKIAKQLEKKVKNIAKDGLNHHVIVVGARGTGKTHLLRILYHRAQPFIKNDKIVIAYFAEEEYGIADYLDFMVRILHAFIRWNEEDAEFLNEQLTILQETPSSHQEETIERIIKSYLNSRPLLILAENFNDILETLKQKGQSKLRAWLYRNERTSIIATAQALSDDIGREDRPFYGFFEEIHLQRLNFDESYELLKSLAKIEKREDVLEHLNTKGLAQVKAIHRLVKGNHRLLVTFYEFLKADLLSDLSVTFIKTLNDLKPYYETYIRYLPPQQQKILRFIAMAKIPQLGKEIARQCFIDQKSLSKQLSELTKKKLIEAIVDVTDKRNKLYDIAEPLLRLSIEIGEHREGVNALFIDFLALYYENEELEAQKNRFSEMLSQCVNDSELRKYQYEIDARERALEIQKNFVDEKIDKQIKLNKNIVRLINERKYTVALNLLEKVKPINRNNDYWILLAGVLIFHKKYQQVIDIFEKLQKNNSKNFGFYNLWGICLAQRAQINNDEKSYELAIEKYEIAYQLNPNEPTIFENWADTLYKMARINNNKKSYELAIEKYEIAHQLNPQNKFTILYLARSIGQMAQFGNSTDLLKLAAEKYEIALEKDPGNKQILLEFGLLIVVLSDLTINKKLLLKSSKLLLKYIMLKSDLNNIKLINDIILIIMITPKFLTIENCLKIEDIILNRFKLPEELKIHYQYLQTYRKVILQGEKQALYELPKEQREFFEQEILAKHEES